jgi:hypothetical protein
LNVGAVSNERLPIVWSVRAIGKDPVRYRGPAYDSEVPGRTRRSGTAVFVDSSVRDGQRGWQQGRLAFLTAHAAMWKSRHPLRLCRASVDTPVFGTGVFFFVWIDSPGWDLW